MINIIIYYYDSFNKLIMLKLYIFINICIINIYINFIKYTITNMFLMINNTNINNNNNVNILAYSIYYYY